LNGTVLLMQAVVEVPASSIRVSWPVANREPRSWLVLDADCDDDEVGLFVASLATGLDQGADADQAGPERIDLTGSATTVPERPIGVVDGLVATEMLIAAGGVRLHDTTTGATVVPGCCAGLEDWRDWTLVAAGESPWLGHDPSPRAEALADHARIWPNGHAGPVVDVPWVAFPELLGQVHRDLVAFADRLADWAAGWGDRGAALVAKIDHDFALTAPLPGPQR
jgi:hypothetical protein